MEMKKTWLIQRLQKPWNAPEGHPLLGKDNPFAFGGGFKNGGLSDTAMDIIRPIFRFDYMGSAEFEYGEVPKAIQGIVQRRKDFVSSYMQIPAKLLRLKQYEKDRFKPCNKAVVYLFCHKDHAEYVTQLILDLVADNGKVKLKEHTLLRNSLFDMKDEERPWNKDTCGWMELDNGFFFFTDEEMFKKTVDLFMAEEPKEAAKGK
jgi:hypothetical protein